MLSRVTDVNDGFPGMARSVTTHMDMATLAIPSGDTIVEEAPTDEEADEELVMEELMHCTDGLHEGSSDDQDDDEVDMTEGLEPTSTGCSCCVDVCEGHPVMQPIQKGAKIYSCASTECSRALAAQVRQAALETKRVHGYSSTGTPWLYARRMPAIKEHNAVFLAWCRRWIKDLYNVESSSVRAGATEPHIVKYNHAKHAKFKGIGTHQDGSFVTCIMALSDPGDFSGGGTYFSHLDETVHLGMGEVLLFQGQQGPFSAPHRAQPISSGKRLLYLAFFSLKKGKRKGGKKTPRRTVA